MLLISPSGGPISGGISNRSLKSSLLLLAINCLSSSAIRGEVAIPVELWDINSQPLSPDVDPSLLPPNRRPRYVMATVRVGKRTQRATLDLGNPRDTLLVAEGCKACGVSDGDVKTTMRAEEGLEEGRGGCNDPIPSCYDSHFCSPSWPDGFVPRDLFEPVEEAKCPDGHYAGQDDDGTVVCVQCFGGGCAGGHDRFEVPSSLSELSFVRPDDNEDVVATFANVLFGAVVYTTPLIDRIWSNVGIGYRSSFLRQMNVDSVLMDLSYGGSSSAVTVNPNPQRYESWMWTSFEVSNSRRVHDVVTLQVGRHELLTEDGGLREPVASNVRDQRSLNNGFRRSVFHIDSGNNGLALADHSIRNALAAHTGGRWVSRDCTEDVLLAGELEDHCINNGYRLVVPYSYLSDGAPDLHVGLSDGMVVTVPGWAWVLSGDDDATEGVERYGWNGETDDAYVPTAFFAYHKNVLGLPFIIATGGMVYNDRDQTIHVRGRSEDEESFA